LFGLEDYPGSCLADQSGVVHTDGLVPTVSADLRQLPFAPTDVRTLPETDAFHFAFFTRLQPALSPVITNETADFPTILCAIDCVRFKVSSPVDLDVMAPDGRRMAPRFAAIPGAIYAAVRDDDGHEGAEVLVPFPLPGEYNVRILPKPGSAPTDMYSLEVVRNDVTTVLAENLRIQDTPPAGFEVVVRQPMADVSVQKHARTERVLTGASLSYSITATNAGPDPATDVTVDDVLNSGTTFESLSAGSRWLCATPSPGSAGTVRCRTLSLEVGAIDTIELAVRVGCALADGSRISNVATVASVTGDPNPSDNSGLAEVAVSNPPPVISGASADKAMLWPPNHNMVDVAVSYGVKDNCDPAPLCGLSVASNEAVDGTGDGDTAPDWEIMDAHHVRLRAERAGTGNGRVYSIAITCTDVAGASSSQTVTVGVPHNQ